MKFILFLLLTFPISLNAELTENEEYGQRYILAALEMSRYSSFENLIVREAQNLSALQQVSSALLYFTSGLDQYDISFTFENVEYTCFATVRGRFVKKVMISDCSNSTGSSTLTTIIRKINSRQADEASSNYQRRLDSLEINTQDNPNSSTNLTIQE
jgi:hypothetical protein